MKIYPTEPWREGIAVMEYVVLNREFGDFDTLRCRPRGTVKSRMAKFFQRWRTGIEDGVQTV